MKEDSDRKEGAVHPGIKIPGIPARKLVKTTSVPHFAKPNFWSAAATEIAHILLYEDVAY